MDSRKRISQVPKSAVFKEINEAVALAYRNSDKMPDIADPIKKQEFSEMVNGLTNYAYEYLPGYCTGELKKAIDLGSCGHYGEFYGLNKRSFVKFLLDHKKANTFNDGPITKPQQDAVSQSPTQEQQFNTLKGIVIEQYAIFKKGKSIFSGPMIYEFLSKLNLIELTDHEREEIFNQAKNEIDTQESKPGPLRDFVRQLIGQNTALSSEKLVRYRAIDKQVIKFFTEVKTDLGALIETKRSLYV